MMVLENASVFRTLTCSREKPHQRSSPATLLILRWSRLRSGETQQRPISLSAETYPKSSLPRGQHFREDITHGVASDRQTVRIQIKLITSPTNDKQETNRFPLTSASLPYGMATRASANVKWSAKRKDTTSTRP